MSRSSFENIPRIVVVEFLRSRKIGMAGARCNELSRARIFVRGFPRQDFFPVRPIAIFNSQGNRRAHRLSLADPPKKFPSCPFYLSPPPPALSKPVGAQLVTCLLS